MASLSKHKADCTTWLGHDFEQVHLWLDEFARTAGATHRRFRHHKEGVEEAGRLFGRLGLQAALIHVLRDCRNIPSERDYASGTVDALGLPNAWPVAAYSQYSEEEFSALVNFNLHGPTGVLLWSFVGNENEVAGLLQGATRFSPEEAKVRLSEWEKARAARSALTPLPAPLEPLASPAGPAADFLSGLANQPLMKLLQQQFGGVKFVLAPVDRLISPLALIDFQYVEELRAELAGDDDLSVAKFSLPLSSSMPVRLSIDPATNSVTIVSEQKTLTLGAVSVQQVPEVGMQINFLVTTSAVQVIVSKVGERLYLRGGIHRAYLLASMGKKHIPCALVEENQLAALASAYPSFSPSVLQAERPPLLADFFDRSLSAEVPLRQTQKVIRIVGQDFLVPIG